MSFIFSSHEIFELAEKAEQGTASIYQRLSKGTRHEIGAALFQMLAEQESDHAVVFRNFSQKYRQNEDLFEYVIDLRAILKRNIEEMMRLQESIGKVPRDFSLNFAVETAIKIESNSITTYEQIAKTISDEFQKPLMAIINLERNHLKRVTDLRQTLIDQGLISL